MKPLRIASFASAGLPAVLIMGLLAYGGSSESAAAAPAPALPAASSTTSIAACIANRSNDVIIGGPLAKADCKGKVEMTPDPRAHYREIYVAAGGELIVSAGGTDTKPVREPPVSIVCIGSGGTVQAGSESKPVDNQHRFEMTFVGEPGEKDEHQDSPCNGFSKGIDVTAGGSLLLYGAEGVPPNGVSWTTLASPAGPRVAGAKFEPPAAGTTTLNLTADVGGGPNPWQEGDWIAVATTTYTPFETEFVQIKKVTRHDTKGCAITTQGCSTVTLMPGEGLKYYHFGSEPPSPANRSGCKNARGRVEAGFLCDGKNQNYGVDERAEVGLISRDIILTASTSGASSEHWGGEIKIHQGFAQVVVQGVRISKFGKDQLGSYPLHFHKVGDIAEPPNPGTAAINIDADSVDHSYNKCVTIHETSNLTIENLVCARIVGHIFYEELGSYNEDNVADDSGIVFKHDLGLGASSNSFDIYKTTKDTRAELIKNYWWAGDYMTNSDCADLDTCIDYNSFNIPDTDNQAQYVRGGCTKYLANGMFDGYRDPNPGPGYKPCSQQSDGFNVYIEPASGFWIQNPGTVLVDDAIAGCQGSGRGIWWLNPTAQIQVNGTLEWLKFKPFGTFENVRVSGCFAGLYDEPDQGMHGEQLFPRALGKLASSPVIARLDGATVTRNRYRGVWLRPSWFVLDHAHLASNLLDVTLVTSGGLDGNYPGVWEMLENSVIVGFSANNVERWGPCPEVGELGTDTGGQRGCIDQTAGGSTAHSAEDMANGYPTPYRNAFGYMIYDGPVLIYHDRFVNFNYNEAWTQNTLTKFCSGPGYALYAELDRADCLFLQGYEQTHAAPAATVPVPKPWKPSPYEGDAALGWFDSNQSAYPTATAVKDLMWTNTNLRHQIFTHYVALSHQFNDGDKNTAVIDEDGTLDGLAVSLAPSLGSGAHPVHPISLNNLPSNGGSNSVEECKSLGAQNMVFEGRDSSLMSPKTMGTLEFFDLYPFLSDEKWTCTDWENCLKTYPGIYPQDTPRHWQDMTFTRDDTVPPSGSTYHPAMTLTSRDGKGVWEPKVVNGYGYTVGVKTTTSPSAPVKVREILQAHHAAGIWPWIDLGFTDVVDPNISASHPFFVRIGICYSNRDGSHPGGVNDHDIFKILRGYKSWSNNASNLWKGDPVLQKSWTEYAKCHDLDIQDPQYANVPWVGNHFDAGCPAAAAPVTQLQPATSIEQLGTSLHPDLKHYYYNPETGMLYLNVAQVDPNAPGSSPSGSCANGNHDPACPSESYYACPKEGCPIYTIQMLKPAVDSYRPGASTCTPDPANLMLPPASASQNQLVLYDNRSTVIDRSAVQYDLENEPYYKATNGPECPATTQTSTNAAPIGPG